MIEMSALVFVIGVVLVFLLSPVVALVFFMRWIGLRRLAIAVCLALIGVWLLNARQREVFADGHGAPLKMAEANTVRPQHAAEPAQQPPLLYTAPWPDLDRVKFTADIYPSLPAAVDSAVAQFNDQIATSKPVNGAAQAIVVTGPVELTLLHEVASALQDHGFTRVFVGAFDAPVLADAQTITVELQPAEQVIGLESDVATWRHGNQAERRRNRRQPTTTRLTLTSDDGAFVNRLIAPAPWVELDASQPRGSVGTQRLVTYSPNLEPAPDSAVDSAIAVGSIQAVYLEGYGALFTMETDLPFSPQVAEQDPGDEESVDRLWEQTKKEMFASDGPWIKDLYERYSADDYDPKRVAELEDTLIDSLAHASNIRSLNKEDWIILAVRGPRVWGRSIGFKSWYEHESHGDEEDRKNVVLHDKYGPRLTVMTLRVKKADVDALAAGELDEEKFRERVSVVTY